MRESKFVEQNKEKWEHIESDLKNGVSDPNVLRSHLIHVTDDLSYARTFYQNRSVRIYMNTLAQKLYIRIIRNRSNLLKAVFRFFSEQVPLIMFHSRKQLGIAFLLLILSFSIGYFSSSKDPEFVNSILSDSYVEMTKKNIESGDPMAVYKDSDAFSMFIRIASNNLYVSILLFTVGLLASYGTIVMMFYNGIMLGAFYQFFDSRGLSSTFNYTVWMHGTVEISAIVVVSLAGLLLGKGLIQPGSYSRIKAFNIWGRRGAMILLSVVPFILFAAFVESYLTRHTEFPNFFRGFFIAVSFLMMFGYFFLFPYLKFRNKGMSELTVPELKPETGIEFEKESIYSGGILFIKSINLFTGNFGRIIRYSLLSGLAMAFIYYFVYDLGEETAIHVQSISIIEIITDIITLRNNFLGAIYGNAGLLFNRYEELSVYLVSSIWLTFIISFSLDQLNRKINGKALALKSAFLRIPLIVFVLNSFLMIDAPIMVILALFLSVFAITALAGKCLETNKKSYIELLMMMFSSGFLRLTAKVLMLLFLLVTGMLLVLSPLVYICLSFIELNFSLESESLNVLINMVLMVLSGTVISFILMFFVFECGFSFYSVYEIHTANGLMKKIEGIGRSRKAYGLETE